jgi:hypothetical protein
MEQQQNDLFAMIGELTYRLQLAQRENERLIDENRRQRELCSSIVNDRNQLFNMSLNADKTISELKEKLNETEYQRDMLAQGSLRHFSLQRQTCADTWTNVMTDLDEDNILEEQICLQPKHKVDAITEEQIDGFYGDEIMEPTPLSHFLSR